LQCNVGWHSITPCAALAIGDERRRTARLRVIKVRPHHAAPTPITLAESSMADRLKAGRSGLQKCLHGLAPSYLADELQSSAAYHVCSITSCLLFSLEDILLRPLLPVITVFMPAK